MESSKANPKAEGKMGADRSCRYGMIGGWFIRTMETPDKRPMPVPRNLVPGSVLSKSAVLGKFAASLAHGRRHLAQAERVRGAAAFPSRNTTLPPTR